MTGRTLADQRSEPASIRADRVLVADDNRDAALTLAELLAIHGYRVDVAFDGPQALAVAERFHPGVLILDIGMPGMDGREVASRLRRRKWAQHALMVAHSGWGGDEDMRRSLDAGFDHHLVKPLAIGALTALIEHAAGVPTTRREKSDN